MCVRERSDSTPLPGSETGVSSCGESGKVGEGGGLGAHVGGSGFCAPPQHSVRAQPIVGTQ